MTSIGPPSELPLPPFFDPGNARSWSYRPDEAGLPEVSANWRKRHRIRPSAEDERLTLLLLIDAQKDFCLPEGASFVSDGGGGGAVEDTRRIAEFLYRNLGQLSEVVCTLDSHLPHHIFFPSFWIDEDGRHPAVHTQVRAEDVREGRLVPDPGLGSWIGESSEWLRRQAEFYCAEIERGGRYELYLWPPHCLVGSDGHSLVGVVQEARLFHSLVRGSPAALELKGLERLTESYSVLGPEVEATFDGRPLAAGREAFGGQLLNADRIVVAGQAASHCVRSTLFDLRRLIEAERPELMTEVYILGDCMSSVVVNDPGRGEVLKDFRQETENALEELEAAGMRVVRSTEPMEEWTG
jgi:nicotinamidase-related amidase